MNRILILCLAGFALLATSPAHAQGAPQQIGVYKDWSAWVYRSGDTRLCYISSGPKSTAPKGVKRGDIHFYVTHRPNQNVYGEVSMLLGYPFAKGKEAIARIGSREYAMKTNGERSWMQDVSDHKRIIAAMKAGSDMRVDGISARGTKTRDTYSLSGFTAAYGAIGKACK